jgi:hypothetical protein
MAESPQHRIALDAGFSGQFSTARWFATHALRGAKLVADETSKTEGLIGGIAPPGDSGCWYALEEENRQ